MQQNAYQPLAYTEIDSRFANRAIKKLQRPEYRCEQHVRYLLEEVQLK